MVAVIDLLAELPQLRDFVAEGRELDIQIAFRVDPGVDAPSFGEIFVHFIQNHIQTLDVDACFGDTVLRH